MRGSVLVVSLAVTLIAAESSAAVRLLVKPDGSKVIYNVGSGRASGRGTDYNWLARQHDRVSEFDEIIRRNSVRHGIDPVLVKAVIQVESNFNPACVSHKGARGLMQLMPGTAKRFSVMNVHDPEENIRGGVAYLALLMKLFPGDLTRVLAAYNAGENAVRRYAGVPPYAETQEYVRRALTVYYGRPHGGASGATAFSGKRLAGGFGKPALRSRPKSRSAPTVKLAGGFGAKAARP